MFSRCGLSFEIILRKQCALHPACCKHVFFFFLLLSSVSRSLHIGFGQQTNTKKNVIFGKNQLRQKRIRKSLLYETIELAWLDYSMHFLVCFVVTSVSAPWTASPLSTHFTWPKRLQCMHKKTTCKYVSSHTNTLQKRFASTSVCVCACESAAKINHKFVLTMCLSSIQMHRLKTGVWMEERVQRRAGKKFARYFHSVGRNGIAKVNSKLTNNWMEIWMESMNEKK